MRCGGSSENAVAPHAFYKAVRAVGRCARDIQMRFADGLRNKMQIGSMTCRWPAIMHNCGGFKS